MSDLALHHKRTHLRLVNADAAKAPVFSRDAVLSMAFDPAMYAAAVEYAAVHYPRSMLGRRGV